MGNQVWCQREKSRRCAIPELSEPAQGRRNGLRDDKNVSLFVNKKTKLFHFWERFGVVTPAHLHPIVVHFALGFALLWLLRENGSLGKDSGPGMEGGIREVLFLFGIVAIGTGWVALAWDRPRTFPGRFFWPGALHECLGLLAVGGLSWRFFGFPEKARSAFLTRLNLVLLFLYLALGATGEWLVFGWGATGR
ncbi:hypothetical protein [Leptospirillum ferriphilum]|uniref:hypothetical protein n=1 Tax=Leptospirillum ferriphilum TaxID=178606 RepID=UPI0015C335A6|nr:hypothetical protein [Leptospirillum ferriphilum]